MLLAASTAVGSAGGFSLLSAGSFVPSVLGGSKSEGLSWELQPVPPGLVWAQCDLPQHQRLALADLMSVKRMMEKMGAPKTHLELKKMISEVTGGVSETISYQDFVNVMLGKRSAVLKL